MDDDNIELPPLPPVLGAPGMNLWIDDLRRAAVRYDRERRAKQEAKPVVCRVPIVLKDDGGSWFPMLEKYAPAKGEMGITICWTADGRAWIESEQNRELARTLRAVAGVSYTGPADAALHDAADSLDGGER